jgi:hypothetical protein
MAAGVLAEAGRKSEARFVLSLYQLQTVGLLVTRRVTVAQAVALLGYAGTAARILQL